MRSVHVVSCGFVVSWLIVPALASAAQEGGAPRPSQPSQSSPEFQKAVDDAVDRRLKELGVSGKAEPQAGAPPAQPPSESVGEEIEGWRASLPFDIHAGAYLWHYEPIIDGVESNTELYNAWLTIDGTSGDFGFHVEPRFRNSKLRPFFESNVWVQEAYGSLKLPAEVGTLKAGKAYSRFGRFWDDTFFGNQPYFDGITLDPDFGLSLENTRGFGCERMDVEYALQYFPNDGLTNGSLQDRDTVSVPGARQRDIFVARVAPRIQLADDCSALVGGSYQRFEADFSTPTPNESVFRTALESELVVGPFTAFGEVIRQHGQSVTDFPFAGMPSDEVDYVWAGVKYTWRTVTFRFAYSTAHYRDGDVREITWLPGLTWAVDPHVAVLVEYDAWRRYEPGNDFSIDRSFNLILAFTF